MTVKTTRPLSNMFTRCFFLRDLLLEETQAMYTTSLPDSKGSLSNRFMWTKGSTTTKLNVDEGFHLNARKWTKGSALNSISNHKR